MPGLRAEGRPVATAALVLGAAIFTVLVRSDIVHLADVFLAGGIDGDWQRPIATTFTYTQTGYELACLFAIAVFGWLLERRHGHWAPLLVYGLGSAAGIALALAGDTNALVLGGNAGALALLCAWVVRDLLLLRAREETDSDMLGVAVIAVVLVLLPAAVREADPLAGAGGAIAGLIIGFVLARLPEK
jgi:membrane associated rhomboid family serine protease